MDSDSDDMPPPLEDMSEQLTAKANNQMPQFNKQKADEDEGEEIRLGPKKTSGANAAASNSKVTRIMPSDDSAPTQKKTPLIQEVEEKKKPA